MTRTRKPKPAASHDAVACECANCVITRGMGTAERAVTFSVPGRPQPKQRARRGRARSGRVIWYTPAPTVEFERQVAAQAQVAFAWLKHSWPTDMAYKLEVHCYFPDARRADADNVLKAVSDALNKLAYADDSQVTVCMAVRDFDRDAPRTVVTLSVLGELPKLPKRRKVGG